MKSMEMKVQAKSGIDNGARSPGSDNAMIWLFDRLDRLL
jgi:hypothetical protein